MNVLNAGWPAPDNIGAVTTTRLCGDSLPPYDRNNLGLHVGDEIAHVKANRAALLTDLCLPSQPSWLEQTHGTVCVTLEDTTHRTADAAVTRSHHQVPVIMTADCVPVLFCNYQGTEIAAAHAGWRGLQQGVLENTLAAMHSPAADVLAWIGPAICRNCFEVGLEVRDSFQQRYAFAADFFQPRDGKWLADLAGLAEKILRQCAVASVHNADICTFEQKNEFFSYRRETQTGRMASLIWFKD